MLFLRSRTRIVVAGVHGEAASSAVSASEVADDDDDEDEDDDDSSGTAAAIKSSCDAAEVAGEASICVTSQEKYIRLPRR